MSEVPASIRTMRTWVKWLLGIGAVLAVGKVLGDFFMANRKVYVSFDYENDRHYKLMLQAWSANRQFDFSFNDASSGEIQTNDISRIKAGLTKKIRDSEVLLVLIGKEANKHHRDWMQIGFRNWINFEIAQARAAGKKLVAVKIDRNFESPEQIDGAGAAWAMSFSDEAVTKALRSA